MRGRDRYVRLLNGSPTLTAFKLPSFFTYCLRLLLQPDEEKLLKRISMGDPSILFASIGVFGLLNVFFVDLLPLNVAISYVPKNVIF